jgi:hypothetical protein
MISDARWAIQRAIVVHKLSRIALYLTGPISGPLLVAQYFSNDSANDKNLIKGIKDLNDAIEVWATKWRAWATAGKRDNGTEYTWEMWAYSGEAYTKNAYSYTDTAWEVSPTALMLKQVREFVADPTKPTVDVVGKKVDAMGAWLDRFKEKYGKDILLYGGLGLAGIVGLGFLALRLSRPQITVHTGTAGLAGCRSRPTKRSHRR